MQVLPNKSVDFKANEKVKGLSNTAKLLLAYMEITGTTCAKTISAQLGIPVRTVQRLKLDCATATDDAATCATRAIDGADETATCATDGVLDAPDAPSMAFSASRVLDNNKLTSLGSSSVSEVSEVKIISSVLPFRAKNASTEEIDSKFEEFWKAFPKGRKQGKGAAKVLFRQIARGGHHTHKASADKLIEAARAYAATKPDPRYTPMPQTWLNGGRWDDDLDDVLPATVTPQAAKPSRILEAIARRSAAMEAAQ